MQGSANFGGLVESEWMGAKIRNCGSRTPGKMGSHGRAEWWSQRLPFLYRLYLGSQLPGYLPAT